jgi:diguanylate cyclase (GGDEF)-like protein
MTTGVASVPIGATLAEAAERMGSARLSCIVVVDGRRPVGVITERDMTALCARVLNGGEAGDLSGVMSDGVISLNADARCSDAVDMIQSRRIRRLVIVDGSGDLAGIITQTDLLRAHAEEIEMQKARLEQRVAERTQELATLNQKLEGLTRVDPMLGVGNRRAMDDELDKVSERAKRYGRPYSVALVDVDHFKPFNDNYGHQRGDDVLIRVAATIKDAVRAADSVYRYGGEEFLVLFPEVTADGGAIAAEHIREAIAGEEILHEHSPWGRVTVSIGVAGEAKRGQEPTRIIAVADDALYRAKSEGRNRVELGRGKTSDVPEGAHHPAGKGVEAGIVDPADHAQQIELVV